MKMEKLQHVLFLALAMTSMAYSEEKKDNQNFTREKWEGYFMKKPQKETEWAMTMNAPALGGISHFKLIERAKDPVEGWSKSILLATGGPMDGVQSESWFKADKKGRWSKGDDGKTVLDIPFPLKIGDSWKSSDQDCKITFVGEYEAESGTQKDVVLITRKKEKAISKTWYSLELGFFYASVDQEWGKLTKRLKSKKVEK